MTMTRKEQVLQGLTIEGLEATRASWMTRQGLLLYPGDKVYRVINRLIQDENGYSLFDTGPTYEVAGRLYIVFSVKGNRV